MRKLAIAAAAEAQKLSPLEVMLSWMRSLYAENRFAEACAIAQMAAPFCHPRLNAATLTVKPPHLMTDAEIETALAMMDAAYPGELPDLEPAKMRALCGHSVEHGRKP